MQTPVIVPVGTFFIARVANKIKGIAINGERRPTVAVFTSAGMFPFTERGHGGFLFNHMIPCWIVWQFVNLSHCRHKIQYGKNTETTIKMECLACYPGKDV